MSKIRMILSNQKFMINIMWRFSKLLFVGKFIIAMLNGVIAPLNAYMLKILVEYIAMESLKKSFYIICIIALINLLNGGVHAYISKKLGVTDDLFRNSLMFEFNSKIVNMDYEILYNPIMMQKKDMALKAIQEKRATKYLDVAFVGISSFINLVSSISLLSSFSWWLYFIVLLICIVKILTVIMDKKTNFSTTFEMAPVNVEIAYYMSMLVDEAYVNDMRMYSISDWVMLKYKKCINKAHGLVKSVLEQIYVTNLIRTFLSAIETMFIYGYSSVQMILYGMSFANFTLISSLLRNFSETIEKIAHSFVDLGENSLYVQNYREFLEIENSIAVLGKGETIDNINKSNNVFELHNVSFRYPNSHNLIFDNINLKIEKGNFYVVVGENGVGKTTLIKLLCRLYDVTDGSLSYMCTDVRKLDYKSYRNEIGVVFQDFKYYCLSIAENVAMNEYDDNPKIQTRILDALHRAGLSEKISLLPNGIHTQLGKILDEEGILLSGGELQKLALARVLFKDSSIVILDEPSSALDALAEDELIKTFNSALQGKTVIYISHRLSVAKYADKVIYIGDKKIKGCDTHPNLLRTIPSYKEMYEAQAKHYK